MLSLKSQKPFSTTKVLMISRPSPFSSTDVVSLHPERSTFLTKWVTEKVRGWPRVRGKGFQADEPNQCWISKRYFVTVRALFSLTPPYPLHVTLTYRQDSSSLYTPPGSRSKALRLLVRVQSGGSFWDKLLLSRRFHIYLVCPYC